MSKIMRTITILYLLFIVSIYVKGQKIIVQKGYFADTDKYKEILNTLELAENAFSRKYYDFALDQYLTIHQSSEELQNDLSLNYKIGKSFLFSKNRSKKQALPYLKKINRINPSLTPSFKYQLARAYHLNNDFKMAISYYQDFFNTRNTKSTREITDKDILKRIKECEVGVKMVKNKERILIKNLGGNINSSNAEYAPLISTDESIIIFTSNRKNAEGVLDENMFISTKEDNGHWGVAQEISPTLNTKQSDASLGLSLDGQKLFVFSAENNGDIYVSEQKGDKWTKPSNKTTKNNLNSYYHEGAVSLSFDEKTLYFTSNNPEISKGGHDLFYSRWNEKNKRWGSPINMGEVINTEYEERTAFIHPDGKTLFFSSEGHESMGGLDIFKSERNADGIWSKPLNLGYPINSPEDDFGFILGASGERGYYASVKENGIGSLDIYMIVFPSSLKPPILSGEYQLIANRKPVTNPIKITSSGTSTQGLSLFKGIVKDKNTLEPLAATLEVFDNETKTLVLTTTSNSLTGKFLIALPVGKNYGINIKADNHLFHSENIELTEASNYKEITKDISLSEIKIDAKIVLNNIFFAFGKFKEINDNSLYELEKVISFLENNPGITVEISGHTDNIGDSSYNQYLSQLRAKSVSTKIQLLSKGSIAKERITTKGYGDTNPISSNNTKKGRSQNRRVEFKIINIDEE